MLSAKQAGELEALASINDIKKGRVCRCGQPKMSGMATCLKCWSLLPDEIRRGLCLRIGQGFEAVYKEACRILKDVPHRCDPPPPDMRWRNK